MKIKSNKIVIAGLLIVPMLALLVGLFMPMDVSAEAVTCSSYDIQMGVKCNQPSGTNPNLFGPGGLFTIIINVALFIIGAVCVLMLIYGGIKYTTSAGEEKAVTSAKNTILYGVVGLVVAILAYALVNFVISALMPVPVDGGGEVNYVEIIDTVG